MGDVGADAGASIGLARPGSLGHANGEDRNVIDLYDQWDTGVVIGVTAITAVLFLYGLVIKAKEQQS